MEHISQTMAIRERNVDVVTAIFDNSPDLHPAARAVAIQAVLSNPHYPSQHAAAAAYEHVSAWPVDHATLGVEFHAPIGEAVTNHIMNVLEEEGTATLTLQLLRRLFDPSNQEQWLVMGRRWAPEIADVHAAITELPDEDEAAPGSPL